MVREENENFLKAISTSDISEGIMPRDVYEEFFTQVQEESVILNQVRTEALPRQKMSIAKLGVGERIRASQSEGSSIDTTSVSMDEIEMDAEKSAVYWQLTKEAVRDASDQQIADKVMDIMSQQFSADTEELAFIGDENKGGFYAQNDGWLEIAESRNTPEHNPSEEDVETFSSEESIDDGETEEFGEDDLTTPTATSGYVRIVDIDGLTIGEDIEVRITGDSSFEIENLTDSQITIADDDDITIRHDGTGIDKQYFHNMIQKLDTKYLRADPAIVVNTKQVQEWKWDIADERDTGLGDAVIAGEREVNPFGYDLVSTFAIPEDYALFTPLNNLIYGLWDEVEVNTLTESDDIHDKDLYAKYKITVRDDFQIEDSNAVVLGKGIKPVV